MEQRLESIIEEKVGTFRGSKGFFAKSIGCDSRMLGRWLKGQELPAEIYLQAIVKNHGVNYAWLVDGVGVMSIEGSLLN